MANLVIVESPAKANTIKSYLGPDYKVIASKGHIRDLPKSALGIDIENGFKPHYINIRGKGDLIKELKKEAKSASKIYLATDPDREGEAISWHIADELGISEDKIFRVAFNEITKNAVREAINNPSKINMDLVNSQQARRILDRLVGFKLSPLLWKNIRSGLSGGRVQSVATRIVIDREKAIRAFIPKEYHIINATVKIDGGDNIDFRFYGDSNGKIKLETKEDADLVIEKLNVGVFKVKSVRHSEKIKLPPPPFTTSTLQQEASKYLGFQSSKTMKIAQELYDGLNLGNEFGGVRGLITYMRTDSMRISPYAQAEAIQYIKDRYGETFVPNTPRVFKNKNDSQDAHEAIRPSDVVLSPDMIKNVLSIEQYKLYRLIWERYIASQMESAVIDTVSTDIENNRYIFKNVVNFVKSPGYMTIYNHEDEEPSEDAEYATCGKQVFLYENEILKSVSIKETQHFTEPPSRYTEATLIKFLEENGIGRPSTYAPIISLIISRDYVRRDGKSLIGTKLGEITTDFMEKHFPQIVDYEFTALMENRLDSIAQRDNTIVSVLKSFYDEFSLTLEKAEFESEKYSAELVSENSNQVCRLCGKTMVYKNGRYGKFLACPDYPDCRSSLTLDKDGNPVNEKKENSKILSDMKCDLCGSHMVERKGKFGEFYACVDFPKCRFTKNKFDKTEFLCPDCGKEMLVKRLMGKSVIYSCAAYPVCRFSSWDKPLNDEKCPLCGGVLFIKKLSGDVVCKVRNCNFKRGERDS